MDRLNLRLNSLICEILNFILSSSFFRSFDKTLYHDITISIHIINPLIVGLLNCDLRIQSLNSRLIIVKARPILNANLLNMDGPMPRLLLFFFKDRILVISLINRLPNHQLRQIFLKSLFRFSYFLASS